MLKKPATKRSRIAAATGSVIATAALTLGGLNAIAPTDTMGAEIRYADFEGKFKSAAKPLEAIGQWATTTYEYNRYNQPGRGATLNSAYSTTPRPRQTSNAPAGSGEGSLCVYGGSGAQGCDSNQPQASAFTKVNPLNYIEEFSRTTDSYLYFAEIQTSVQCTRDGNVSATQPTGIVTYKAENFGANPSHTIRIENLNNGVQHRDDFKLNRFQNTYVLMEMTSSWGADQINKRAFSEVVMTITSYNGNDRRPTFIKFRSECGLYMNDNTGSKGPSTSTSTVSSGAVLPEVDVESGAEIPAEGPTEDTVAELENAAGFGRPEDLELNGSAFEAEATRELTDEDRAYIGTVLDQASVASADEGMIEGLGWIRRQANGLPVVTLELPGGGYARVTPKLELSLPELTVEETTTNADADADAVETNSEEVE